MIQIFRWDSKAFVVLGLGIGLKLEHVSIWLGPTPPTRPSLPGHPARTCMGTFPLWELIWQYLVKFTNIQVDITFIIPNLINEAHSHGKGA
jgi:hypothetical protein